MQALHDWGFRRVKVSQREKRDEMKGGTERHLHARQSLSLISVVWSSRTGHLHKRYMSFIRRKYHV